MYDVVINRLVPQDSVHLSAMLTNSDIDYGKHFIPFAFDDENLKDRLKSAENDRYWGIWFGKALAGFFMLRGFDEGYSRPSFGVFIAQHFAGCSLSSLALSYAISWCRLNSISSVMLKVHPDNINARDVYEKAGFRLVDVCPRTGHNVMERSW